MKLFVGTLMTGVYCVILQQLKDNPDEVVCW